MLKLTVRRRCAAVPGAAAAKQQSGGKKADAASKEQPPTKKSRESKPHTDFRPLSLAAWQKRGAEYGSKSAALPESLLFHGNALGPRPLVVLGGSVPTLDAAAASAAKFSPMLSQAAWGHGAIYVPLLASSSTASAKLLEHSCNTVAKVLDAFGIGWTHVVGHGLGALVAAKMCFTHPTRIGTMVVVDTPLVDKQWIANTSARLEIARAQGDVNVPASMLASAVNSLKGKREAALSSPDAADIDLFKDILFNEGHLFGSSHGVTRNDDRYLSTLELGNIKHPLQLVLPQSGGACEAETHKEFFNIRRLQLIKSAASHQELFSSTGGVAEEIGGIIEQWAQRFEPDIVMSRRYDTAAKDMRTRMQAVGAPPAETKDTKPHPPGKKKDQKKK